MSECKSIANFPFFTIANVSETSPMSVTQVSGLATSAVINIGLTALFLALYSVFRKQPGNARVYFARHLIKQKRDGVARDAFSLERFVPSVSWVKAAWKVSEEEILQTAGLDAYVLNRMFVFSIRFFTVCTILGIFILIPLHYITQGFDFSDIPAIQHDALDKFTISNVPKGSNRLWVHLAVLYCISLIAYCLLYLEYRNITRRRLQFLRDARPQPDQFTVLVRSVPKSDENTYGEHVEGFFSALYPSSYLLHHTVYRGGRLEAMMQKADKLFKEVQALRSKPSWERPPKKDGFLGWFGNEVDPLESSSRNLESLQHDIKVSQSDIFRDKKELPVAFVSFKSRATAAVAAQTQQSDDPLHWVTEWAPEPRDVQWSSFSIHYSQLWLRRITISLVAFIITIFFVFPVGAALALARLEVLQKWFPPVRTLLLIPGLSSLLSGYLPSLALTILYYFIPSIMLLLSHVEGYASRSGEERKSVGKMFYFLVGNTFLIVTSGSLISLIAQSISSPKEIPARLAMAVSGQANFFMSFILTKGWTGFSTEILEIDVVLMLLFMKHILRRKDDEPYVQALPYYRILPNILIFLFIGFMYTILAPLLLPFLIIYLILGYVVFRNQIMNVYEPAYETGGQYWPHIHNRMLLSIFLMQITCLGMFGLKAKPMASTLTIPLPILTLLFSQYCNMRFSPNFEKLSVEIAVSKDNDDENHGFKDGAVQFLQSAYVSPPLRPVEVNENGSSTLEHLLSSTAESSA